MIKARYAEHDAVHAIRLMNDAPGNGFKAYAKNVEEPWFKTYCGLWHNVKDFDLVYDSEPLTCGKCKRLVKYDREVKF